MLLKPLFSHAAWLHCLYYEKMIAEAKAVVSRLSSTKAVASFWNSNIKGWKGYSVPNLRNPFLEISLLEKCFLMKLVLMKIWTIFLQFRFGTLYETQSATDIAKPLPLSLDPFGCHKMMNLWEERLYLTVENSSFEWAVALFLCLLFIKQ